MAALTVQSVTAAGVVAAAATQITAWSTGDTIAGSNLGSRGVLAIVTNSSGGSLDFRVEDPGLTPAGNTATNGYTTHTVANGATRHVLITRANMDPDTGLVKVGASTTNAGFTVRCVRY